MGATGTGSGKPVDEQTVFRITSVTTTITAVTVMQLHARGLVDLDAVTGPVADGGTTPTYSR